MSVKSALLPNHRGGLLRILILWQLAAVQPSWAIDMSDLYDSFLVQPDWLKSGVSFPVDSLPSCQAQVNFKYPLALGDAVDVDLCNNPQVSAAWAQIKIQGRSLGEARAAYLLTINAFHCNLKNSTTYPATSNTSNSATMGNQVYGAFKWRLFEFGGRAANHASANQLLAANMAARNAALQRVMVSTIQAYFDAVTDKALFEARRQTTDAT